MITPDQCRAARALLSLSQDELSALSGVTKKTLADFERGARQPYQRTIAAVQATLERKGVVFIPENGEGPGVRLTKLAASRAIARGAADRTKAAIEAIAQKPFEPGQEAARQDALEMLKKGLPDLEAAAADDDDDDAFRP